MAEHPANTNPTTEALAFCDRAPWNPAKSFAEDEHPGLFIGLFLDAASAAVLAIDGGEPAEKLHITLAYVPRLAIDNLALARIVTSIANDADWRSPLTGSVSGHGRFYATESSDAFDVFYASPDVRGLDDLRSCVVSALRFGNLWPADFENHGWVPHLTLAYLTPGAPDPVAALPDASLSLTAITVGYGDTMYQIPLRGSEMYGEVILGEGDRGTRIFTEVTFAEPPKRVAILPTPGTYKHPQYGEIEITAERVDRFVANHNAGIYGQKLPIQIDAGHDLKFYGAMGWLGDARIESDGSATAEVSWNPRGEQLIKEDRVSYLSPEFYDVWTDATDGAEYQDVLIGLALTNRPFFKSSVLTPITPLAAEEDMSIPTVTADAAERVTTPANDRQEATGMSEQDTNKPAASVAMSEDVQKKFAEVEKRATDAEAKADQFAEANVKLSERLSTMEAANRKQQFTLEVRGKSDANGTPWVGDIQKHVALMESLATAFGEDSEQFTQYRDNNRAHAVQMVKSGLFHEVGTDRPGNDGSDPSAKLVTLANAKVADGSAKNFGEAMSQLEQEQPTLFAEREANPTRPVRARD